MTKSGPPGVALGGMTTTQSQRRASRSQPSQSSANRAQPNRTGAAPVPAQRRTRQRPGHRYQLDTDIKELTPAERAARGHEIRSKVPRSSHADFDPAGRRFDPVQVLIAQSASRQPDLVPIRYGRMLASPFAYFRGAALPMANDLSTTPATGLAVQACGDAHVGNFGMFGTAERRLVFDINDFDETLPGPWEWDVKRLAASLEISARENGIKAKQRSAMVRTAVRRYRLAMARFASQANLAVWYASADIEEMRKRLTPRLTARERANVRKGLTKARTKDSMQALDKLTRIVGGKPQIVADPP